MNRKTILIAGLALAAAPLFALAQLGGQASSGSAIATAATMCTMEAKQCPDGSWVGRSGPNCQFSCPGTTRPSGPQTCPIFNRGLSKGMRGDDIAQLQQYLGVSATGFFGPLTAQALARFQAQENIPAIGILGPQTRAAFARRCGQGNANFKASPTSGDAPLTVNFSANRLKETGSYQLDFGDGSTTALTIIIPPCAPGSDCSQKASATTSHTYAQDGTYTATLSLITNPCPAGAQCFAAPILKTIGTVTITVGASLPQNSLPFSADPSTGHAPLAVTFTTSVSITDQRQFAVEFGDRAHDVMTKGSCVGIAAVVGGQGGIRCSYATTHTYMSAGTYTATLSPYIACMYSNPRCMIATMPLATATITVGYGR